MDKSKLAAGVFNKWASLYQSKYMDVSLYADTLDLFCQYLPINKASLLEIACGPGNITQYLLKKRPALHIFGIDLAPNMIELAIKNNPQAHFEVMDCREIGRLTQTFDGIMAGFCLPYLSQPAMVQLIADAAQLLDNEGLLYLSTMEDVYEQSGLRKSSTGDEIYMHFYQAADLTTQLQKNGFKVLNLVQQAYPTTDGSKVTDLIIIAQKQKDLI